MNTASTPDPDKVEDVVAHAYLFYQSGQLDQAESFFRFLCLCDFHNAEYALGLGVVHQLKREYQKAIDTYALAFALASDDYRPMFHSGQCQLALKKLPAAIECFENVVKSASDGRLIERAKVYLDALHASEGGVDLPAPDCIDCQPHSLA